jgi:hypothetical protein
LARSVEESILTRARPQVLAARIRDALRREASKGCSPELAPGPVALEPVYQPIRTDGESLVDAGPAFWTPQPARKPDELVRLQLWISPEQPCPWLRSELFLKHLSGARGAMAFELLGNREAISLHLLCGKADLPLLQAAFYGQFEQCVLAAARGPTLGSIPPEHWAEAVFLDYFPFPPYSHLLTRPDELQRSPYATFLAAMAMIEPPALSFYQILFAPVAFEHNWRMNIQTLSDLEYSLRLVGGIATPAHLPQQVPSGELHQMSDALETKAHNDKPFFSCVIRIGVVESREDREAFARSTTAIAQLFQHGGRPLQWITEREYFQRYDDQQIGEMFAMGLAYRPGFLVNSEELTSLVHVPAPEVLEPLEVPLLMLDPLMIPPELTLGTPIGVSSRAGREVVVCIPENLRTKHIQLIGRPGMGKSSAIERMVLHDICQGHGVAVLDPHHRLVDRLLCLIPEEHVDRVIYLDFSDPNWVPIWNPLCCGESMSRARVADELVRAFKSFVSGWGDRLEHLLRHAFFAVLHLPGGSLLDVSNLLRQKSDVSRDLRRRLLRQLDNEVARVFWREDFGRYGSQDLFPPQHKLSKLLAGETAALMLSQGDSLFHLRDVMESGKILLVNLANLGPEVLEIQGCFLLSLLHVTALSRRTGGDQSCAPFHIYCDEAHRFLSDAVEDLIAETRKFNVSLTLAHQYMRQFTAAQRDALYSVGSTVIFNVDTKDAAYLRKDLQEKVDLEELIRLKVGQAIARIGTHIVRFKTRPPLEIPAKHYREEIIARSRARYCRPVAEVRAAVRSRNRGWHDDYIVGGPPTGPHRRGDRSSNPEDFSYETL